MFLSFLGLSILSVLWFVFNTSSGDFFSGAHLLKLMISPFLIIALFNTFVIAGVPALLLTSIFAILFRNKKSVVERKNIKKIRFFTSSFSYKREKIPNAKAFGILFLCHLLEFTQNLKKNHLFQKIFCHSACIGICAFVKQC